jgi:hypothetical protein
MPLEKDEGYKASIEGKRGLEMQFSKTKKSTSILDSYLSITTMISRMQ